MDYKTESKDLIKVTIQGERPDPKDGKKRYIQRLPSPIFFKVIGSQVYYVAKRIPEVIYGEKFIFSSQYKDGSHTVTATVPTKEQLGGEGFIDDFLAYCMEEINRAPNAVKSYCKSDVGCDKKVEKKGQRVPCAYQPGQGCRGVVSTVRIEEVTV